MLLFIDAGNSFVKLAQHDGANWRDRESVSVADFAGHARRLAAAPAPSGVIIANVAGERFRAPMQELLANWRCPARWVTPQREGYGVVNGYAVPDQLGADRWVALIGARRLTRDCVVVASVGTAVTIDTLSEQGRFLGGLILPGLELMRDSLARNTAGVAAPPGRYSPRPDNTADAVHSGALLAVAGAIEKVLAAQRGTGYPVQCLITGGGAEAVAPFVEPPPRIVPDLELEGLLYIARQERML
jgi:type III pantothenate kinase